MKAGLRSQKGALLVQVVVLIALLAFIVATVMQLVFARRTTDARAIASDTKRQTALGLESQVMDCLNNKNPQYGQGASCDFGAANTCISGVASASGATISASGSPPSCGVQITVPDS